MKTYIRYIQLPGFTETLREIFTAKKLPTEGRCFQHSYVLMRENNRVVGELTWNRFLSGEDVEVVSSMPSAWQAPLNSDALAHRYHEGGRKPLEAMPNMLKYVSYLSDGRMHLQRDKTGAAAGAFFGIPGTRMKERDDVGELRRQAWKSLFVNIHDQFAHVGDLYDPEHGRTVRIYRITKAYDSLLTEQLSEEKAMKTLTRKYKTGQSLHVSHENLEALLKAGHIDRLAASILETFRQLMPPARQAA